MAPRCWAHLAVFACLALLLCTLSAADEASDGAHAVGVGFGTDRTTPNRMLLQTVTARSCDECIKACKGAAASCSSASVSGGTPAYKCECSTGSAGSAGKKSTSTSVSSAAAASRVQAWASGSLAGTLSVLMCLGGVAWLRF